MERAVEESISILGPKGFVLSTSVNGDSKRAQSNLETMIKTCKRKLCEIELQNE